MRSAFLEKLLQVLIIIALFVQSAIAEEKNCAIILLHGKWGNPYSMNYLGRRFEPTCDYKSIELPWSQRRSYDEPYLVALSEIKDQVRTFRAQGYKRVLLVGHSFGANAALAYMAEIGDVDGIIALAPGHSPASMYKKGIGKDAVDEARQLVSSGKGNETLFMEDSNQGRRQSIRMTAAVLLSYFDPDGLGNMPTTTARFKKTVPLMWVVGTKDPLYKFGADFAFNKAPVNPFSKYLVVEADHSLTPDVASSDVLEWIKRLP